MNAYGKDICEDFLSKVVSMQDSYQGTPSGVPKCRADNRAFRRCPG